MKKIKSTEIIPSLYKETWGMILRVFFWQVIFLLIEQENNMILSYNHLGREMFSLVSKLYFLMVESIMKEIINSTIRVIFSTWWLRNKLLAMLTITRVMKISTAHTRCPEKKKLFELIFWKSIFIEFIQNFEFYLKRKVSKVLVCHFIKFEQKEKEKKKIVVPPILIAYLKYCYLI